VDDSDVAETYPRVNAKDRCLGKRRGPSHIERPAYLGELSGTVVGADELKES
jgi:hypothetical protein